MQPLISRYICRFPGQRVGQKNLEPVPPSFLILPDLPALNFIGWQIAKNLVKYRIGDQVVARRLVFPVTRKGRNSTTE